MNLATDKIVIESISDGGESHTTQSVPLDAVRDLFRGATPIDDDTYVLAEIVSFTTVNGIITAVEAA